MVLQFIVFGYDKKKMTIDMCDNEKELESLTVLHLKQKIAARLNVNQDSAVAEMKLVFAGAMLGEDCTTLSSYGLVHKSTIQMMISLDGGLRS